jgi:hypothetical protein
MTICSSVFQVSVISTITKSNQIDDELKRPDLMLAVTMSLIFVWKNDMPTLCNFFRSFFLNSLSFFNILGLSL